MQTGKFNIVVDGAWGSCGKGLVSGYLAERHRPEILSTTNMANAGHTVVDRNGDAFIAKALPSAAMFARWRQNYSPRVVLGASAAFNLDQLLKEAGECGLTAHTLHIPGLQQDRLWIHPRAGVITDEHRQREAGSGAGSTKHIASTMQGCGTLLSDKILRRSDLKLAGDYPELDAYVVRPPDHYQEGDNHDPDFDSLPLKLARLLRMSQTLLHEGSQGFSLDIHHGSHYPQCYSPDTLVTVRKSTDGVEHNIRIRDLADESYNQIKDLTGWVSLEAAWERPNPEPLLAIVAGQHTLPVTVGHPVLVRRNGDNVELRADQVLPGDWVYTPVPERPTPTKRLDAHLSYSVGYYLGDGRTIGKRRERMPAKSRAKERERYARYRARRAGGSVGTSVAQPPAAPKRSTQAYGVVYSSEDFYDLPDHLTALGLEWYTKPTPSKASKLYIFNSDFARQLDDLGIKSELAPNKRLMPDFMSYDNTTLATILAGHIDADGGVYNGSRIRFGISSLILCAQWQRWLHSLGIKCLVRPEDKSDGGHQHNPETNKWRLEIRFHANQRDHEVLWTLRQMSRKMANYRPSKTNWFIGEQRHDRTRTSFWGSSSQVLSVSRINGSRAWDVSTGTQYFLANGVRGHNCTSRQCTAPQALADMGLPVDLMGEIYLVIRPYPIRVGNVVEDGKTVGHSGDAYPGQTELSWDEIGNRAGMPAAETAKLSSRELTTVTRRLRRVFEFSDRQVREAAGINGATQIFLNFANYIDWKITGRSDRAAITPPVLEFMRRVERATKIPVTMVGTGPRIDNVIDLR